MLREFLVRSTSTSATRLSAVALLASVGLGAAAPAHAEVVSKLPGAGGLPFPAQFLDASTDGRYVLLLVGPSGAAPAASGPEADLAPLGQYVLRDRVADTTTPLTFRVSPGSPQIYAAPIQVSDDGDRILIQSEDANLRAFTATGTFGLPTAVYDRSDDKLLKLPSTPTPPSYGPTTKLSADGTQALFRTIAEDSASDNPRYKIYRGPLGGTATAVLDLPNTSLAGASTDLQTILYSRTLPPALRPVEDYPRTGYFSANVVGAVVGSGSPRILTEDTRVEAPTPGGGVCSIDDGISVSQPGTGQAYLAPDGSRSAWLDYTQATGAGLAIRAANGTISRIPSPNGTAYFPQVVTFGSANQILFDPPINSGYVDFQQELVKGDTELIKSATGRDGDPNDSYSTRYVEAAPYSGAAVTTPAPTMTFTNEPVDTIARKSSATWYSCPPGATDAPIGAFEDYVRELFLARPYSAKYAIGSAILRTIPSSSVRKASKITAELTVLGLPYWKKSVTGSTALASFPKPFWGLPMTLKFTVQPAAQAGQPAPAPLVRTYSIFTTKTN